MFFQSFQEEVEAIIFFEQVFRELSVMFLGIVLTVAPIGLGLSNLGICFDQFSCSSLFNHCSSQVYVEKV